MNANELAEALENMEPYLREDLFVLDEAANTLKHQKAEIEMLRNRCMELQNIQNERWTND